MNSNYKPIKPLPYTEADLLSPEIRDTYQDDYLRNVRFPLGGIGSGCISLAGNGKLVDWAIFNAPNRGFEPFQSFLSLWVKPEGEQPRFKVLEGPILEDLTGPIDKEQRFQAEGYGIGPLHSRGNSMPRFRKVRFNARFPFATVSLEDKTIPLEVSIEGWSPFIPGNSKDSSIPVAILKVKLKNISKKSINTAIGVNVQNCIGSSNTLIKRDNFSMLYLAGRNKQKKAMFIASPVPPSSMMRHWPKNDRFLVLDYFLHTFGVTGKFVENDLISKIKAKELLFPVQAKDYYKIGSLGYEFKIQPGESIELPIIIGWFVPSVPTRTNYYAKEWKNGIAVAEYVITNLERLETQTRMFQTAFFSSTLPGVVLEAVSANLSILRSPTLIRFDDGTLYGWEGCAKTLRLGHGTINHVYNYQQAIPYLFPDLQRSIDENLFKNGLRSNGATYLRLPPLSPKRLNSFWWKKIGMPLTGTIRLFNPAADGQFGQVCWAYREWLISGDDAWLRDLWPNIRKALEYAWVKWDKNQDGLLEGPHHNTLDLDFNTPDTFCGSLYQAALLAGEKIATILGDEGRAKKYRQIFELGKKLSDEKLFNGDYYQQLEPIKGMCQFGSGCISGQLHGQLYSKMLGLDDIYDSQNIKKALGSVFLNNYFDNFFDFPNANRVYSTGDDSGLVVLTWPKGNRPEFPSLYCDETQNGYEYEIAGNLLYGGYLLEGITVIKSIRDRFDGKKRNPFCEFEWGNFYVRSLASYNALLALSGWRYCAAEKRMTLQPQIQRENFKVFFSVEGAWGTISQTITPDRALIQIKVCFGKLNLMYLHLNIENEVYAILINEVQRPQFKKQNNEVDISFDQCLIIESPNMLKVDIMFVNSKKI